MTTVPPRLSLLACLPFLVWVGFVVCLFRPGAPGFVWAGQQPWGDKLAHVLLIGTAAFLLDHAVAGRRFCRAPLAALIVAVGMTAEEVRSEKLDEIEGAVADALRRHAEAVADEVERALAEEPEEDD